MFWVVVLVLRWALGEPARGQHAMAWWTSVPGVLTVDHARSPASVMSGVASSAIAFPSSFSISSDLTPFDSRNVTFRSRGASRIVGSSRKREACSSSVPLSAPGSCLSWSVDSWASGARLVSLGSSDDVSRSGSVDCGLAAEARCHAGMTGLFDMSVHGSKNRMRM